MAKPPTEWDGLKPQNVVQAAREDIARRRRNEIRASDDFVSSPQMRDIIKRFGEDYEHYAFMRHHVRDADGPFGLIHTALDALINSGSEDEEGSLAYKLKRSTKRTMRHIYNSKLLTAALEMEKPK